MTKSDKSDFDSIVVRRERPKKGEHLRFSAFFVPKGGEPPFGPVRAESPVRAVEMLCGTLTEEWR